MVGRRSLLAQIGIAIAILVAASGVAVQAQDAERPKIVVGQKLGAEQAIIAEMTTQLLTGQGFDVERAEPMGSAIIRKAQETGRVDVYWEDTATSLRIYNKIEDRLPPEELYEKVKELDAEKGIVWLEPSAVSHTYALAMRGSDADELGVRNLSELAGMVLEGAPLKLAASVEFTMRPDGLKPMEKAYAFKFPRENVSSMDPSETYEALNSEDVEVALVFTRDARVADYGFFVLEDDKHVFPAHVLAPVVRAELLEKLPRLRSLLSGFAIKLDNASMRRLNVEVEVEKKPLAEVARAYLREQDLN